MASLRVLLVNLPAETARWVTNALERAHDGAFECHEVADETGVLAALCRESWGLVVTDWAGGDASLAVTVIAALTEYRLDTPAIAVGLARGEGAAVEATKAGLDDYVVDGDDERLISAIRRELAARSCGGASSSADASRFSAMQRRSAAQCEADLRLRRLFDSGMTGVIVCNVRGHILEANDTFLAMVGYSRADLVAGRVNWLAMTPPEFRGKTESIVASARASGGSIRFEKEYLRQDGTRVPVLIGTALLDEDRYLTVITDLSHRKLAEARTRAMFDSALDAIVGMDDRGTIIDFNPAAERTFGYSRDDVMGRRMSDVLIPLRFREMHERGMARFLATGEAKVIGRVVELTALRRDGVEIPIELALSCVDVGGSRSFFGFLRDVSERKRVESALVDRARVAGVGATIGLALTRSDSLHELFVTCCEALVKGLGVAFARVWLLDRPSQVLELQASAGWYTRIDGPNARIPVGQLKIGRIAARRRRYVSNDVPNDPLLVSGGFSELEKIKAFAGYPLLVDGERIGVLAIFSEEPLSEITVEMLESVCDAIAVRVRGKLTEKAKSTLEEQLRQSQKMEAIGRLAGGIAHDFNNVLSVVLSYAELMMAQTKPTDPLQADIREINFAAKRAADLTRQLLLFSRQQVMAPVVLDVSVVFGQMDKMLRRILGEDVELSYDSDADLGNVRVDQGSIEQVIVNLVVNARDAMPRGGALRVAIANVDLQPSETTPGSAGRPGPHVRLSVSDTGIGMDSATLTRIYEPFFTTKPVGKGTGLGLATVFGIVQQSGGFIRVRSEVGVGTTFEIFLPRVEEGASSLSEIASVASSPRGTETILLVEDEDQVRVVAAGILRRHGYQVLDARNAGDALLLCETHVGRIHLLLTDVVMPHLSGPELARRLAPIRPDMRVLCMSGYTDDAVMRHGIVEAEAGYLQKPFSVASLTAKVRSVLDLVHTNGQSPSAGRIAAARLAS